MGEIFETRAGGGGIEILRETQVCPGLGETLDADMHRPEGLEFQGHLRRSMCPLLRSQVGPEPRKCPGDARRNRRGRGDGGNQEDVPESACIRAKNKVRSYQGFSPAQINCPRCPRCQAPGWAVLGTQRGPYVSVPGDL